MIKKDGQNGKALLRRASILALITIFYNLAEGVVSTYFGISDETIALTGFGLDSFVELLSGLGIFHMIERIKKGKKEEYGRFERTALTITGLAFYILAIGLVFSSILNIYFGRTPTSTFWGIVISLVSISVMWILVRMKLEIGRKLNSDAIVADAKCTKACMYLSLILLFSSAGYELTGIGYLDSLGALGIAFWSFKEGKEAHEKAKKHEIEPNERAFG